MKKLLLALVCLSTIAGCGRRDESSSHSMKKSSNHMKKDMKHGNDKVKKHGKEMMERK
jgi:uncharacterized lipoprotein YehR (DUF1307 family)